METYPSWGVLVRAPERTVRDDLSKLGGGLDQRALVYRANGDWTAAFYVASWPATETAAGDALRARGHDPALLGFDHDVAAYYVRRWNGHDWAETGEDPIAVCSHVGILAPGETQLRPPTQPHRPSTIRSISLVMGATLKEVRDALGDDDFTPQLEASARGVLVTDSDLDAYLSLSESVDRPVYHLEFDPSDGRFVCLMLRGGETLQAFVTGDTWVPPSIPRVGDIEGETAPLGIVETLGIGDRFPT